MKNLKKIVLTRQEWLDALKMPTPVKNKKKYTRKEKHKNGPKKFHKGDSELS